MNEKICKMVVAKKTLLVPSLFTEKQVSVLERYISGRKLSRTEQACLYSAIKKKVDALGALKEEFYEKGSGIIKERVERAKEILHRINKEKAFISGTFLYAKNYNDIDIYIISRKRKQHYRGKEHYIYITESDLRKPIFLSASKCSVANFHIEEKEPIIKRPSFNDLIVTYEMAINEILDDSDQKTLRDVIFEYHLQTRKEVLDSYTLHSMTKELKSRSRAEKINEVNRMVKEILLHAYSNRYTYLELIKFLSRLRKDIASMTTNDNLIIYRDMLTEAKDECRRAESRA
jgi:predicted nucleotidyltransferase